MVSELESEFRKRNIGGVKIGNIKIWSLDYADDLVLLALNKGALLDVMDTLKIFLKIRDQILSTDKSKVLVYNK